MTRPDPGVPLHYRTLGKVLPDLLASVQPDLVLYDAGVDPHQSDALGRLSLSSDGLFRRDMQVQAKTFALPPFGSFILHIIDCIVDEERQDAPPC